jgi:hypothetical protein
VDAELTTFRVSVYEQVGSVHVSHSLRTSLLSLKSIQTKSCVIQLKENHIEVTVIFSNFDSLLFPKIFMVLPIMEITSRHLTNCMKAESVY